jgi:beta-glucosidase
MSDIIASSQDDAMDEDGTDFPVGFEWGTASAAHQIEGGNWNNDWWRWEHDPSSGCREPSGDACDSWNRWTDDVAVVADLGLDTYRFSIEWSRIEPEQGEWSNASMDQYVRMCEALRDRGVTPVVTFHHFTTPRWVVDLGGWREAETAKRLADFAERAATRLGPLMGRACTVNEPNIVGLMGFILGVFPPGVSDPTEFRRATEVFVDAHHRTAEAIRSGAPGVPVGLTVSMAEYVPAAPGAEGAVASAERTENVFLDAALDGDFIGIQAYTRMTLDSSGMLTMPEGAAVVPTMGYERAPEALGATLRRAWQHTGGAVPLIVTENGIATDDDADRIDFVRTALASVRDCLRDGIDVRGYTYWSILDNFEWAFGYRPRFGLVDVDRTTFRRTPKPSARWLAEVASTGRLDGGQSR